MDNKITPSFIHLTMKTVIKDITEVCEQFSAPSELFLFPMYALIRDAMFRSMHGIGDLMASQDNKISGMQTTDIIIEAFESMLNRLKNTVNENRIENEEKSHNEQLTEKLMLEMGLS